MKLHPQQHSAASRGFGAAHAERLAFVRHCRNLDMTTLDEIRVLLRCKDAPQEHCGEVNALLDERIGHVAWHIRELRLLEKTLKESCRQCSQDQLEGNCGILNELIWQDTPPSARPGTCPGQPLSLPCAAQAAASRPSPPSPPQPA
jgi:DNA-binding transcriptional MerR regulator